MLNFLLRFILIGFFIVLVGCIRLVSVSRPIIKVLKAGRKKRTLTKEEKIAHFKKYLKTFIMFFIPLLNIILGIGFLFIPYVKIEKIAINSVDEIYYPLTPLQEEGDL